MPRGILLLEGADSSGKTTLAAVLREKYGAAYIHGGLYRDPWKWHVAAIYRALRLADERLVVIDRNWLSHLVYGEVFKNLQYDVAARCLDRALRRAATVTVLCVPGDPRRQESEWVAGAATGKREHFASVREVIALYQDLAAGNVARPGDGYLGQLIRYGDYADRDDVLLYDRFAWADRPAAFAAKAVHYLGMLRTLTGAGYPGLQGTRRNWAGRVDKRRRDGILFVANRPPEGARPGWPLGGQHGSAVYFTAAAHRLGLPEERYAVVNAADPRDSALEEALSYAEHARVIALGDTAYVRLAALGAAGTGLTRRAPHPAFHRRFCVSEGVAGYAERLSMAIRS